VRLLSVSTGGDLLLLTSMRVTDRVYGWRRRGWSGLL